jgi:hypothetical protein
MLQVDGDLARAGGKPSVSKLRFLTRCHPDFLEKRDHDSARVVGRRGRESSTNFRGASRLTECGLDRLPPHID